MSVLAISNLTYPVEKLVNATMAFDSSYPTGGETINATAFGLSAITRVIVRPTGAASGGAGYVFDSTISSDGSTANILVYRSGGFTPAGTVTGTAAGQTFTGTPVKPTFTITKGAIVATTELGLSADAATATVNNNAIASTLTLTTNSPVEQITPAGTNGSSALTASFSGTAVSASVLVEVSNGTSLATLTAVPLSVYGY